MHLQAPEIIRAGAHPHSAERTALAAVRVADQGDSTDLSLDDLETDLIAREAVWHRDCDRTDNVKAERDGREVSAEDQRIWTEASTAYFESVEAVVAYRPRNAQQLLHKALILANEGDHRPVEPEQFVDIYLADAEALAAANPPECLASNCAARFANELRAYEKLEAEGKTDELRETWQRMEGAAHVASLGWARSPAGLAFRLLSIGGSLDVLLDGDDEAAAALTQANIRDTIANVIGVLGLPFNTTVAEYLLGEKAMAGLK